MHALIIGATGATGADLLEMVLKDDSFTQVDIFVRRAPDLRHDKLNVHVIDFDAPERWRQLVKGDVLFSCLRTTIKAAGLRSEASCRHRAVPASFITLVAIALIVVSQVA